MREHQLVLFRRRERERLRRAQAAAAYWQREALKRGTAASRWVLALVFASGAAAGVAAAAWRFAR